LSFHATKLFHIIEGSAVITQDDAIAKKIRLLINFGITSQTSIASVSINAKMNEFEAALDRAYWMKLQLSINKELIYGKDMLKH
jgi:dTDP-4-amino-4,6-dideoxygalactose transaminase